MAHLAAYARSRAGTPELAATVQQLHTHGHGRLSLHLAMVARDLDTVAAYLRGPDPRLRRAALRAVRTLPVPDEAVVPVLDDAPTALRLALYRTLYAARRSVLADALLGRVRAEYGDTEAVALLPACTPETVNGQLPDLVYAVRSWHRLARRHPGPLLALLSRQGEGLHRSTRWNAALRALDAIDPAALVELVSTEPVLRGRLPRTRLLLERQDIRHYPRRYPALHNGSRELAALDTELRSHPESALRLLRAMPRAEARAHLERLVTEHNGGVGHTLLPYLELLPRDRAVAEARRMLHRPAPARDPHIDLGAIAHLPYPEAHRLLTEAATSGDPQRRCRARTRLIEAAARTGDADLYTGAVSEVIRRHRGERDSAQPLLLRALAASPPRLLATALPELTQLCEHLLQAPDTSWNTVGAVRELPARLLFHPLTRADPAVREWAVDLYALLVRSRGADGLPILRTPGLTRPPRRHGHPPLSAATPLEHLLCLDAARDLYERLVPHLESEHARGEYASAIAFAATLGPLAHELTGLQELLRTAILAGAGAAAYLYHFDGPHGPARALEICERDPAKIHRHEVWQVLLRQPPPVLERLLAQHTSSCPAPIAPFPRTVTARWPAAVVAAAVTHLNSVIEGSDPVGSARALRGLGELPGSTPHLAARLDTPEPSRAKLALHTLGRSDQHEQVLELLAARLGGPDQPLIAAVMARCAGHVRPSRLGPFLASVLDGSTDPKSEDTVAGVSVRKEAARLLIRHRPPGAVTALLRALEGEREQRDVRAAALGALTHFLDDSAVLPALRAHAPSLAAPELQGALSALAPYLCPPAVRTDFARVVDSLPEPPTGFPHLMWLRATWLPHLPDGPERIITAVCDPAVPDDTAVGPFMQLLRDGRALDRVEEVFGRLLAGQPAGVPLRLSDGETSIRPVARLRSVARACAGLIQPNGAVPADLAVRLVRLLGEHPQHLAEAVRLTDALFQARAGEGAAPAELVAVFATVLEQLARHPLSLLGWLRNLVRPVVSGLRARGSGDGEALTLTGLLLERARRVPGPEGAAAGLFAVLVAEEFGNRSGWARRWSKSLVAAGECGHDQVRELARTVALG